MSLESFLSGLSFNLIGPDVRASENHCFHLQKPDGSTVTLLGDRPYGLGAFELGRSNTCLPSSYAHLNSSLRDLASIPKMSTFAVGSMIDVAVSAMSRDHAFVNVGVWCGYSFLAGLIGNPDATAVGIDNFSQLGKPRDRFLNSFREVATDRHRFIECDFREVFNSDFTDQIGVYIYDGDHSYESQLDGLRLAEPFFAEGCVIIVDDTNLDAPHKATLDFVAQSSREYQTLLDVSTAGNGHQTLWNGLLVLREGSATSTPTVTSIPAPDIPNADPPSRRTDTTVSVLVNAANGDEDALAATLQAMRSQSHGDVELLAFGPSASSLDVDHHESAVNALAASRGSYALLVPAGFEPDEQTVERVLALSAQPAAPPSPGGAGTLAGGMRRDG